MDHKSNLWDEELTAHLNQSVHVHLTSLRFTDTLKIKNTILTYYFSPTAAVCMERGCAVNFYCMLSNCLVISILPQLTIFKALFHSSFWASKSSTPAWSCRVKTCGFWFCWVFFLLPPPPRHTEVQQSYLGLSLLPAFILAPSNGEQEEAVAGTQR